MSDTPATVHSKKWVHVITPDGQLSYRDDTHFMQIVSCRDDNQTLVCFSDFQRYIRTVSTFGYGRLSHSVALMDTGKMLMVVPQRHPN